jgi:hypothetical protein
MVFNGGHVRGWAVVLVMPSDVTRREPSSPSLALVPCGENARTQERENENAEIGPVAGMARVQAQDWAA